MTRACVLSVILGLSLVVGCVESGGGAGTISGTVHYEGAATGAGRPLAIALYRSYPPSGPPVAIQLVERYELPFRYVFEHLRPGTYYVGALIDVDRMDTRHAGMLNEVRDPYGYAHAGAPLVVAEHGGVVAADIELTDRL